MKRPIYPSKLFSTIIFDKLFYLNFFNNYSENLLLLYIYIYSKNISFKKNKFDMFLVIFYIHNFKYIYFPRCLIFK